MTEQPETPEEESDPISFPPPAVGEAVGEDTRAPIPFAPPVSAEALISANRSGELAGYGRRVGGYLLDLLVLLIPTIVLTVIGRAIGLGAVAGLLGLVGSFLYAWLMIAKADGSTVGMKAVKVVCVDEAHGNPVSNGQAAGRAAVASAFGLATTILIFPALLDLLWPIWDKKNQTLHDKIAKTVVLNAGPPTPSTITFS